jgi:putative acetyltransferase
MNVVIRNEAESDIPAIADVMKVAFETLPISGHTEEFTIKTLRAAKVLTISLVAEADGKVVGHVAFSPVTMSDGTVGWYGLGPVSVLPALHRQGIGKSLIRHGLASIETLGAKGCILVGDPGYYERFGFRSLPELTVDGVPHQYVLALPLQGERPSGRAIFHEGFSARG